MIAFWLIMALLWMVDGVRTFMGKEDNSISCLNKSGSELYDVNRVRLITALRKFAWGIWFVTLAFMDKNITVAWFMIGFVILSLVILFILKRTWAKSS